LQPIENELMKRAALAPTFNKVLYTKLLCEGIDNPLEFEVFTRLPGVERVPYTNDEFWIRDGARGDYLKQWSDKQQMDNWSQRVAESYTVDADRHALKILELQIIYDPEKALAKFEHLYLKADAEFDLARCFALLGVLRSRALNQQLFVKLQEYTNLYESRALFSEEYCQTVDYFQRHGVQRQFRDVLRGRDGKWIFHAHGPGGMGKTMLLRWLIAHRLIQRRLRIPCVWLDFDSFSLTALTHQPWLLALPISEQLEKQSAATNFATLARELQPFRRLLTAGEQSVSAESEDGLRHTAAEQDYWPKLENAFGTLVKRTPVVFFLDTIEEASLHRPEGLLQIIDHFARLRKTIPEIRLVLAGRHALGHEHIPEYADQYGKVTEYAEIHRLNQSESEKFFSAQASQVKDDVKKVILQRADGNPFKLSLLAELMRDELELSSADLLDDRFDDIEIAYLIQRVVRRIPERDQLPVRWVVRYGAVPRRLTKEFVEQVLAPPLECALSGRVQHIGDDMVDEAISAEVWKAQPGFQIDCSVIWGQLAKYSSTHGWISIDKGDPHIARLHPDVVVPMRRLLSRQKIFPSLQNSAIEYFEKQGSLVDVLFHKYELDRSNTFKDWSEVLRPHAWWSRPKAWRDLTETLLGENFKEAEPRAQALAHWHAAEAIAAMFGNGTLLLPSLEFDQAQHHLLAARQLEEKSGQTLIPESVRVCQEAAQRFQAGANQSAAELLLKKLKIFVNLDDRVRLLMHLAEIEVRTGLPGETRLAETLQLLLNANIMGPVPLLREHLAAIAARHGAWTEALEHYQQALDLALKDGTEETAKRIRGRLIALDITIGRYSDANDLLVGIEGIRPNEEPQNPEFFDLHAKLALATYRPAVAIDFASTILMTARGKAIGDARYYRAEAYHQQLQLSQAIAEYESAAAAFSEAGNPSGIDRCIVREVMLHALTSGDLVAAEQLLERTLRTTATNPSLLGQLELVKMYVAVKSNRIEKAREIIDRMCDPTATGQSPHQLAYFLMAGLGEGLLNDGEESVRRLVGSIDQIRPASSRIALLGFLQVAEEWPQISPALADRLVDLFPYAPQDDCERTLQGLAISELLRVIGRGDVGRDLLIKAVPEPVTNSFQEYYWYFLRLEAESRLRRCGVNVPASFESRIFDGLKLFEPFPLLVSAMRLSLADGAIQAGLNANAEEILDPVEFYLNREPSLTIYSARNFELRARLRGEPAQQANDVYRQLGHAKSETPVLSSAPLEDAVLSAKVSVEDSEADDIPDRLRCTLFAVSANPEQKLFKVFRNPTSMRRLEPVNPFLEQIMQSVPERIPTRLIQALTTDWIRASEEFSAIFGLNYSRNPKPIRALLHTTSTLAGLPWEFGSVFRPPTQLLLPPIRTRLQGMGQNYEGLSGTFEKIWSKVKNVFKVVASEDLFLAREVFGRTEAPNVMIINSQKTEKSESGFAYRKIPDIYRERLDYSKVMLIDFDPEEKLERLRDYVAGSKPDIILFVSGIIDSPTLPEPMLESGRLLPSMLRHIVSGNRAVAPTVIIDVPRPSTPFEALHQLFARNRFCFELLRAGGVTSVIGTGLGSVDSEFLLHNELAACITSGPPCGLDEALDRVRSHWQGNTNILEALPFLGTAIFTNEPSQMLVPNRG